MLLFLYGHWRTTSTDEIQDILNRAIRDDDTALCYGVTEAYGRIQGMPGDLPHLLSDQYLSVCVTRHLGLLNMC